MTERKHKAQRWSAEVTEHSDALDLEADIFESDDPAKIAHSLKRSAERSNRRKSAPFRSAMSMLTFYINRAGKNLSPDRKRHSRPDREYLCQTNQSEVSIKIRGGRPGVEIKGLVAVCRSELVPFAPYVELWCKWRLQASALEMTKRMIIQKTRWIRTYDTSRAAIVEIPLKADEKPLNGQPLPQQGCNVEISKIQIAEDPRQWWTLGFEAFGDLDSAPGNLLKTAQFLITRSFPLPICGEFLNYPAWLAQAKS